MKALNPEVDQFISKATQWKNEMEVIRPLLLDEGLNESIKWSKPCYDFEGGNVTVIQGFKDYFALLFFKGILMDDPENILVKTGKNTRVGRQIRFKNAEEIIEKGSILSNYLKHAIEIEKSGAAVPKLEPKTLEYPVELENIFDADKEYEKAFLALTPGRQRGYIYHFTSPKQSHTIINRIEKYREKIFTGKGLNDRD